MSLTKPNQYQLFNCLLLRPCNGKLQSHEFDCPDVLPFAVLFFIVVYFPFWWLFNSPFDKFTKSSTVFVVVVILVSFSFFFVIIFSRVSFLFKTRAIECLRMTNAKELRKKKTMKLITLLSLKSNLNQLNANTMFEHCLIVVLWTSIWSFFFLPSLC